MWAFSQTQQYQRVGGAVLLETATAEFTDVTFDQNLADEGHAEGGALGVFFAQARFTRCRFSANLGVRVPRLRRRVTTFCQPSGGLLEVACLHLARVHSRKDCGAATMGPRSCPSSRGLTDPTQSPHASSSAACLCRHNSVRRAADDCWRRGAVSRARTWLRVGAVAHLGTLGPWVLQLARGIDLARSAS